MSTPWVIAPPKRTMVVGVADMLATNNATAEIMTHALGSCLGIAVYDPVPKVGGLLHVMLPDSSIDRAKAAVSPFMFVDTGVPRLFHTLYGLGAVRQRLVIRIAGGAQLMNDGRLFNIGERNLRAASQLLAQNGHPIHAKDVGGKTSRTVRLELSTGKLSVQSPGNALYFL
jgi:chemotaxis protein CheD